MDRPSFEFDISQVRETLRPMALDYWEWYHQRNRKPNLIGYKDFEVFFEMQVVDSLLPYLEAPEIFQGEILLDMGTGGGFPLLVLHYWASLHPCPWKYFLGIDSIQKKIHAVENFLRSYPQYASPSLRFYSGRMEEILLDRPCVLVFKAIGTCKKMLFPLRIPSSVRPEEIRCIFYKGAEFWNLEGEEMKEVEKTWENFYARPLQMAPGPRRYLIAWKNKRVPRGTLEKEKNNSVKHKKLSEIL